MNKIRFLLVPAALGVMALLPVTVFAQGTMAVESQPAAHPINVNKCSATRNTTTWAGYTPAYYPYGYSYGRYWGWPSVYGATYYQYPVERQPTLAIDYMNRTNRVMKEIEFGLIARGSLVAEVKDVGTFSPGAEIKHEFGLNPNVFPLQTSYTHCVPLKITFADGTRWKNPRLPAFRRSMYGSPH
jgi:hypothetical protein